LFDLSLRNVLLERRDPLLVDEREAAGRRSMLARVAGNSSRDRYVVTGY
jgi:hypothetical protein